MEAQKNEEGLYEVEIDGKKYQFAKWGAEEALSNLLKLAKVIGKPLGIAMGAFANGDDSGGLFEKEKQNLLDRKIDFSVVALALDALTGNMDEAMVISLIKKLSSVGVLCDGAKINFNTHYEDRLPHLFQVVYAGLEVQYGNFFDALFAVMPAKGKPKGMTLANRA